MREAPTGTPSVKPPLNQGEIRGKGTDYLSRARPRGSQRRVVHVDRGAKAESPRHIRERGDGIGRCWQHP